MEGKEDVPVLIKKNFFKKEVHREVTSGERVVPSSDHVHSLQPLPVPLSTDLV